MLLREGFSRGSEPTLPVLEISRNTKRQLNDILPYLPVFTHLFAGLPKKFSDMKLKIAIIPVREVECITRSSIKVDQPLKIINDRKGIDLVH